MVSAAQVCAPWQASLEQAVRTSVVGLFNKHPSNQSHDACVYLQQCEPPALLESHQLFSINFWQRLQLNSWINPKYLVQSFENFTMKCCKVAYLQERCQNNYSVNKSQSQTSRSKFILPGRSSRLIKTVALSEAVSVPNQHTDGLFGGNSASSQHRR